MKPLFTIQYIKTLFTTDLFHLSIPEESRRRRSRALHAAADAQRGSVRQEDQRCVSWTWYGSQMANHRKTHRKTSSKMMVFLCFFSF